LKTRLKTKGKKALPIRHRDMVCLFVASIRYAKPLTNKALNKHQREQR
jgi:hypothetical protein